MLFLAFPESPLSGAVLGLALLLLESVLPKWLLPVVTYSCRLRSQRLATWLLSLFVFTLSALTPSLVVLGFFVARALPLLAGVGRSVAGKRANHVTVNIFEIEAVVTVDVVNEWAFFHADIGEAGTDG